MFVECDAPHDLLTSTRHNCRTGNKNGCREIVHSIIVLETRSLDYTLWWIGLVSEYLLIFGVVEDKEKGHLKSLSLWLIGFIESTVHSYMMHDFSCTMTWCILSFMWRVEHTADCWTILRDSDIHVWTFCVAEQQELKERHVADRQQWEDRSQADLEVRMFLNGFR